MNFGPSKTTNLTVYAETKKGAAYLNQTSMKNISLSNDNNTVPYGRHNVSS